MANSLQIPGLFLPLANGLSGQFQRHHASNTSTPQSAQSGAPPLDLSPHPPSLTSPEVDTLGAVVNSTKPSAYSTPNVPHEARIAQPGATSLPETRLAVATEHPSDREDGELTDVSMGISSTARSPANERKRKAASPVDDSRRIKATTMSGSDKLRSQRELQAQYIVSTLLANGFPAEQLVQDIFGIVQARRQQAGLNFTLPSPTRAATTTPHHNRLPSLIAPAAPNAGQVSSAMLASNALVLDTTVDNTYFRASSERALDPPPSALATPQTKVPPAKAKPRDPQAYKSRLEALKKIKQASTVEILPDVKSVHSQVDSLDAVDTPKQSSGVEAAPSSKSALRQKQLDMGKLQMRIAALRAENASKHATSLGSSKFLNQSGSATPDRQSGQDESPLWNFSDPGNRTKGRATALDLIEDSNGNESPQPHETTFKTPMGIDQEFSMIIEASSSENSDDEHDSSDKLEVLMSDIEVLNARIAAKARELKMKQSSKSPAVLETSDAETPAESLRATDVVLADATELLNASNELISKASPKSDNEEPIVGANSDARVLPDLALETKSTLELTSADVTGINGASSTKEIGTPLGGPSTDSDHGRTDTSPSPSVGSSDDVDSDDGSNQMSGDEETDNDAAPMSIDSGDYPTPEALLDSPDVQQDFSTENVTEHELSSGDESGPMDISDSASEDYEPQPIAWTEDVQPGAAMDTHNPTAPGEQSGSDLGDEESEDEYDPELELPYVTGASMPPKHDYSAARSASSSGSVSRSPTPEGEWRIFPQAKTSSGVTIRDESGTQPAIENAAPNVDHAVEVQKSFIPYEPKLRFRSDAIIDPLNLTS